MIIKKAFMALLALAIMAPHHLYARKKLLKIKPIRIWREYENRSHTSDLRIILCCQLHIHRRGTPLMLKQLRLQWQPDPDGTHLPPERLIPSLYICKRKKAFKPIHDNMVASGTWNYPTRSINFELNKKLIGKHRFFIVVHASTDDAQKLLHGRFVYTDDLPLGTQQLKTKG